jgi:hypothetical protein
MLGLAALVPGRSEAQRGFDIQGNGIALVGAAAFVGAGAGAGLRAGLGSRVSLAAAGGRLEGGAAAARIEGLFTYHLFTPGRPRPAPYVGTGLGLTATTDATNWNLVVVLGVEAGAQRRGGWFLELGVGGGVRIAAGYRVTRWRRPGR